jgi:hypothetical protein
MIRQNLWWVGWVAGVISSLSVARNGAAQEPAPTAQEIFAKYLAALGGAEKLAAVKTLRVTERIRSPKMSTELMLVADQEKWVLNYESSGEREGYDGQRKWWQKAGKPEQISEHRHYPYTDSHPTAYPLNLVRELGAFRFAERTTIQNREVFRLKILPEKVLRPDRLVYPGPVELHFDVETGFLRTAIYFMKKVDYEDYRPVGDLMVAHRRKVVYTIDGVEGMRGVWDVLSIELNPELPSAALEPVAVAK